MSDQLTLGRYRPLETAGSGGSGTVEICWDTVIQRRVAIKRIPIPETNQPEAVPGLAEARTGAMLKHPGIVSVIDFQTEGAEAFLIMEAIEGPSVSQLIDETPGNMLDLDVIAAITDAVAEALDFAHSNQVLHLDIKPDNIMIDAYGRIKVTDFGISELAGANGYREACGGTIGYMPPEQINGDDMDQRTDAFALAATVYEMLTGRRPFGASSLEASLKRIENGDYKDPAAVRRGIPAELDDILRSALSPDPDERFETVLELADEIIAYTGDPKEGEAKLAEWMQAEDDSPMEGGQRQRGAWNNLLPSTRNKIKRGALSLLSCVTAVIGAWSLFSAIGPSFGMQSQLVVTCTALVALVLAVVTAIGPVTGGLLTLLVACVGTGMSCVTSSGQPLFIIAGIIAAVACVAWAIMVRGKAHAESGVMVLAALGAIAPVAAPVAAACMPLAALNCGYALRPARSATTMVLACVINLCLGLCATQSIDQLFVPLTWIGLISWVLSALFMSAFCARESRVLSEVGVIVCFAFMIVAQAFGALVASGYWLYDMVNTPATAGIAIATVVMCIACALNAPQREEEDE